MYRIPYTRKTERSTGTALEKNRFGGVPYFGNRNHILSNPVFPYACVQQQKAGVTGCHQRAAGVGRSTGV